MEEDKDQRIAELEGQRETLKAKVVDLEERISELEQKLGIYEYTAHRMGWKLLEKGKK